MAGSALLARSLESSIERSRSGCGSASSRCALRASASDTPSSFPGVHVAGTNGKGSVCAMVESIARAHGLRRVSTRRRISADSPSASASTASPSPTRGLPICSSAHSRGAGSIILRSSHDDGLPCVPAARGRRGHLGSRPRREARRDQRATPSARGRGHHAHRPRSYGSSRADPRRHRPRKGRHREAGASTSSSAPAARGSRGDRRGRPRPRRDDERRASVSRPAHRPRRRPPERERAHRRGLGARIGATSVGHRCGIAEVRWPGRLERSADSSSTRRTTPTAPPPSPITSLARLPAQGRPRLRVPRGQGLGRDARHPGADRSDSIVVAPRTAARAAADPSAIHARHPGDVAASIREVVERFASGGPAELVVVAGSIGLVGDARAFLLGLPTDPPVAL